MTLTFVSLKEALRQPFAPETIQFLPKEIHQENGNTVCLALPYANKRVYEDRLNELVFGEWSTPYASPYSQGNKVIIAVTVVVLGVAHTDYGEAFLTTTGKNGNTREDENTVTEAYSQAFRRACAQFLLGRYLYDLPKLTLPYDSQARRIAIPKAERIAWVEKLYMARGLLPRVASVTARPSTIPQTAEATQKAVTTTTTPVHPNTTLSTSQLSKTVQASEQATTARSYQTSYPKNAFLDWVCRCVNRDPKRIEDICTTYKVAALAQLSTPQREALTKRLQQQAPAQVALPIQH